MIDRDEEYAATKIYGTPCKNCKRDTHPHFIKRYHGYCLECDNAGAPEKDERIAELETGIRVAHAQLTGWAIANACSDERLAGIVKYLAGLVKED